MKKIVFITTPDAEYGFDLAGVIHYVIQEDELDGRLGTLMADPDTGLVVVDERLIRGIDGKRLREIEERWHGILLILPAPERLEEVEDFVMGLIKRAIGYHVRLRV